MNYQSPEERLRRASHAHRLLKAGATVTQALRRAKTSREPLIQYLTAKGDRLENYGARKMDRNRAATV